MKPILMGVMAAFLAAGAQSNDAERQLKAAVNAEMVNGDLKAAIKQYGEIVSKHKNDRVVTAMALVHMAECYRKMGDAESSKLYERVVREYADQKEAVAMARARLGGSSSAVYAKGDRAVWTGPKVDLFGRVSPDGRFLTFTDWSAGAAISLHDLRTGSDRPLTKARFGPSGYIGGAQFSTISRDSKQVAYEWYNEKNQVEIRVVPVEGSGMPESRRVFAASSDSRKR